MLSLKQAKRILAKARRRMNRAWVPELPLRLRMRLVGELHAARVTFLEVAERQWLRDLEKRPPPPPAPGPFNGIKGAGGAWATDTSREAILKDLAYVWNYRHTL